MKRRVLVAATLALFASVAAADAEEVKGRITGVDDTAHRVTLDNGHTYALATVSGAGYFAAFNDNFHVGEKVLLIQNGGVVTEIDAQ